MNISLLVRIGVLTAVGLFVLGCRNTGAGRQAESGTVLTGSYLPQDVERNGQFYNGSSYVRTLDENDIKNSGAATPRELLRRQGVAP